MDLIRSSAQSPLPRAAIPQAETQTSALVTRLGDLATTLGVEVPTRVLPGDMPSIDVLPEKLMDSALYLRDQLGFNLLSCISGTDMIDHLEAVYHLRNLDNGWVLQMKVRVPPETNEIESLVGVWITANWLERETFDLYGFQFTGHPDLRRILLDDDFVGFPLLKSFRPSPMTVHDRATTQTDGQQAVAGGEQRGQGHLRALPSHLSQGDQERFHPGTPTFGSTQFHGREFPPQTWKHMPDYQGDDSGDTHE